MTGWIRHEGMAAGLPLESIDTDQLIPARFMSAPRSEGYGRFLLHDMHYDAEGNPRDFPLPSGTVLHWSVWDGKRQGTHTLETDLEPHVGLYLISALGAMYWDMRPCEVRVMESPAADR